MSTEPSAVQVHKTRNVLEHLPESRRPRLRRALAEAYALPDAAVAKRRLTQLAAGLERAHPGAAASLREGLDETLTHSVKSPAHTAYALRLPIDVPARAGTYELGIAVLQYRGAAGPAGGASLSVPVIVE